MMRASPCFEPSDDILFFHRPLPAESTDLILYLEEQITELLFEEESLADVLYRFIETGEGLLIAVARKKTLREKPLPKEKPCCRIPAAVYAWMTVRVALTAQTKALVYLAHGDHAYLVVADANTLFYVYRLKKGTEGMSDLLLAVDKAKEYVAMPGSPVILYSPDAITGTTEQELHDRSIECVRVTPAATSAYDSAIAQQWDFRLEEEIRAHEQRMWKVRAIQSALFSIVGIAAAWFLLLGGDLLLERIEQRLENRWKGLKASLAEITFLQRETRSLIEEITLCRKLSLNRTSRASVLQEIAQTRPVQVKLAELRIGERRKRFEKGKTTIAAEELMLLVGYSDDATWITSWMESLLKNDLFASVTLIAMERKGSSYRFRIECVLRPRSGGGGT